MLKVFYPILFFCWGSVLNSFANFLISNKFRLRGIYCNLTAPKFNWYNLFVEFIAAIVFTYAFYNLPQQIFLTAFLFFSALLVTIRTDLEHMLISEAVTLYLIPAGIVLSYLGYTWTSWQMALAGAVVGYLSLFVVNKLFFMFTKKEGIGSGDMDLLAMVGSFTGLLGIWFSILVGSITASIIGIILMVVTKSGRSTTLPFGPFIASGAILFIFLKNIFINYLL